MSRNIIQFYPSTSPPFMIPSFIDKARGFLSAKKVSVAIIVLVIIARVIQLVFFYNLRVDGLFQAMAAQNFATGHGVSITTLFPDDLSTIVYEPLISWPPGYSLLLSPFYILFDHNYVAAGLTLDILAAITLILISRRILKILEIPVYLVNIYTLFTGSFIYYFYFIASSDAIAITFFMIAFYYSLLVLRKNEYGAKMTAAIIVSLFLVALIKYLFMPIVFVIPAFLILKGFADQNLRIKKTGILSFLILAVALIALLAYQKFISGSAAYISEPVRGFFPENLLVAYPFFPGSFINPESIGLLLPGQQRTSGFVFRILQCMHLVFLLAAIIYMMGRVRKCGFKKISLTDSFFYLAFFISAGITLLLALLSIRVAKEKNMPGVQWTYIEEARYYGLVNVLLHLGVFVLYQYYRLNLSVKWKYVIYFLLLLMLPEMFRGFLFSARRIANLKKEEYSWQYERRFQQYADAIIRKEQRKKVVENIVVTGSLYYLNYRVSLYSRIPALNEVARINDLSSLNTKKPTLLLIMLYERDLPDFQPFLSKEVKEVAGYFDGYYFYTAYVYPH